MVCCYVLYVVLYDRVSCSVVRGCAVSRRYINAGFAKSSVRI